MFDLPKYGDGVCLARMAELLDILAVDRARLQRISVVVTGSNGKGSTAAFCAGIGRAYGVRTGLFTSPHLYRFNERFQVDGTPSATTIWRGCYADRSAIAEIRNSGMNSSARLRRCSRWRACIFRNGNAISRCSRPASADVTIRYVWSVRALPASTSVDYEHVELLGDSLELIVSDKSDACASGGTIIYGENCRA